jgi:hypothetical protein
MRDDAPLTATEPDGQRKDEEDGGVRKDAEAILLSSVSDHYRECVRTVFLLLFNRLGGDDNLLTHTHTTLCGADKCGEASAAGEVGEGDHRRPCQMPEERGTGDRPPRLRAGRPRGAGPAASPVIASATECLPYSRALDHRRLQSVPRSSRYSRAPSPFFPLVNDGMTILSAHQ